MFFHILLFRVVIDNDSCKNVGEPAAAGSSHTPAKTSSTPAIPRLLPNAVVKSATASPARSTTPVKRPVLASQTPTSSSNVRRTLNTAEKWPVADPAGALQASFQKTGAPPPTLSQVFEAARQKALANKPQTGLAAVISQTPQNTVRGSHQITPMEVSLVLNSARCFLGQVCTELRFFGVFRCSAQQGHQLVYSSKSELMIVTLEHASRRTSLETS